MPDTAADVSPQNAEAAGEVVEVVTPIVVDLGRRRAKQIKALKKGRGKLMDELAEVLEEVYLSLGDEADGKTLVPVVVLYGKKKKKRKRRYLFSI